MRQYLFKILIKPIDCLQKKSNKKSRSAIVTFVRYNTRNLVFKIRKKLKGSRISITETNTVKRIKKFQAARDEHDLRTFERKMYWDAASDRVKLHYN